MYKVSIIIPTYNERDNIEVVVKKLAESLKGLDYEIIVVDDNSPDGTAEVAEALSTSYPLRLIKRPTRLGLTSAIYDGFRASRSDYIVVMDADLQHPPELVPKLVEKLRECDVVIASRYTRGGRVESWSLVRRVVSALAVIATRLLVPGCSRIHDPISGYFAARREVFECWRPIELRGYKALVEIIAQTKPGVVCEEPYTFRGRERGASKLSYKQILYYAKLLAVLGWRRLLIYAMGLMIILTLLYIYV
jgi:dolichol-phosphate mannosyltransferase